MKIGTLTKITNPVVAATESALPGHFETSILNDDTEETWQVIEGTVTFTAEFDSINISGVGIFNCVIEDDITINIYNSVPTLLYTETVNVTDLVGIDKKHYIFDTGPLTGAVKIELVTNGPTSSFQTSVGFLWAGDLVDWGCVESIQPFDEATDSATVTQNGGIDPKKRYNFQRFNIATNKEQLFNVVQARVRVILQEGVFEKRPFLIDEKFTTPFMFLGTFDSGVFPYDLIEIDDGTFHAVMQLGVNERF